MEEGKQTRTPDRQKDLTIVYLPLFTTFTKEQRHSENVFGVKNGRN